MSERRKYFESKGPSEFITEVQNRIKEVVSADWKIGGLTSLTVKHLMTTKNIRNKFKNNEFTAQIWMERPQKGYARCKFEVASNLGKKGNVSLREEIADSLRSVLKDGLPQKFEEATLSTIIATRINLPNIITEEDDCNITVDENEIIKVVKFYKYIDEKLMEWNNKGLINFIEK